MLLFLSHEDGHQTESQVSESSTQNASLQRAQEEEAESLRNGSQCPSLCRMSTLSHGHVLNSDPDDCLNKHFVNGMISAFNSSSHLPLLFVTETRPLLRCGFPPPSRPLMGPTLTLRSAIPCGCARELADGSSTAATFRHSRGLLTLIAASVPSAHVLRRQSRSELEPSTVDQTSSRWSDIWSGTLHSGWGLCLAPSSPVSRRRDHCRSRWGSHGLVVRQRLRHQMSAEFTFVPTFIVTSLPDLDASSIHGLRMLTCFALPSPLRLTRPIVAEASRCRVSPHTIPRSLATLCVPSPFDAALTAAYSSLSAVDNDTTCCFFVHTFRQWPPLHPTLTAKWLGSRLQSAQECVSSSPLCCQRKWHFALGLPARYLP